jgi:hypothetical protein
MRSHVSRKLQTLQRPLPAFQRGHRGFEHALHVHRASDEHGAHREDEPVHRHAPQPRATFRRSVHRVERVLDRHHQPHRRIHDHQDADPADRRQVDARGLRDQVLHPGPEAHLFDRRRARRRARRLDVRLDLVQVHPLQQVPDGQLELVRSQQGPSRHRRDHRGRHQAEERAERQGRRHLCRAIPPKLPRPVPSQVVREPARPLPSRQLTQGLRGHAPQPRRNVLDPFSNHDSYLYRPDRGRISAIRGRVRCSPPLPSADSPLPPGAVPFSDR